MEVESRRCESQCDAVKQCICSTCCDGYLHIRRSPSPNRRATKYVVPSDIVVYDNEIPYISMFPSNIQMNMRQIQEQQVFREAAAAMNDIMEEVSISTSKNRNGDAIRERLKRKLAAKQKK